MDVYYIRCFVQCQSGYHFKLLPSSGWQLVLFRETHLDGIGGEVQDAERRRLWEDVRVQRRDQVVAQVQD